MKYVCKLAREIVPNIMSNIPWVNPVFVSGGGYSNLSFVGGTSPLDKHLKHKFNMF